MKRMLDKNTTCRLAVKGKWAYGAAAWMGLSFFLRMVYYFGLINLRDVPGFEVFFSVVLPLAVSVGFVLTLKLQKLFCPLATAGLAALYAALGIFAGPMTFGGIFSAVLALALALMILAALLGYIPQRKWILWAGVAALAVRLLLVDLGLLLPLFELNLFGYIRVASNLFGTAAIASLGAALVMKKNT